ncbi:hypothetical protein V9T40_011803 [Parthenolecanium corni]|uniref:Uncharacterized protein n=1 Tax=Parthenolecanium corni TaxID=536013 RepID=A0AAN9TJC2_9HEMI
MVKRRRVCLSALLEDALQWFQQCEFPTGSARIYFLIHSATYLISSNEKEPKSQKAATSDSLTKILNE